ncbi:unnamed protein product [Calicophoron daubneyi]|uniref:SAM domain-containing protein n=1 Tax=Calicophoron daubneyi TaxID=300641 RepID=A0AAV2T697_CALDB
MSLQISSDSSSSFEWDDYLTKTSGHPADQKCFKQSADPPENKFEVGVILEAEDQRSAALDVQTTSSFSGETSNLRSSTYAGVVGTSVGPSKRPSLPSAAVGTVRRFRAAAFTLARVVETWGPRLRIRLVGTDDRNDCWFLVDSDQIRPYPSGNPIQPPFGYIHNHLVWSRTLKKATEDAKFAEASWFISPPPDPADNFFKVGDKLEAVDRRNTQLICPASVGAVDGQHILVSFDGWSGAFDYWTRFDSRELFPVGWCKRADYPLQFPGPNALRSPASHSTPSVGRRTTSHPQAPNPLSESSARLPRVPKAIKTRRRRPIRLSDRPRRRRISNPLRKRRKPLKNILSSFRDTNRREPGNDKSASLSDIKLSVSTSWPKAIPSLSQATYASDSQLQSESADSSMLSLSSPPIIHPATEDINEPLHNSSTSSDQPPSIEAAFPLSVTSMPHRGRRPSSSSDCVVRLQVKSPPVPLSSSLTDQEKPELKSWQVVTGPLAKSKKTKASKRHKHSLDRRNDRLTKKLKILNGLQNHSLETKYAGKPTDGSTELHRSGLEESRLPFDGSVTKPGPLSVSVGEAESVPNKVKDEATDVSDMKSGYGELRELFHSTDLPISAKAPLHLYCDDFLPAGQTVSGQMPSKHIDYTSPGPMDASSRLDVNTSHSIEWFSTTKFDGTVSKLSEVYPVSQVTDDGLDGQSTAPLISSSTVSPSSLDLGPCPLPNPAHWTIDEVYHYLTTRDSTLIEVAQKFKHHEIDGQALLLLSMESLRNYLKIKLGPALKVDHIISRLKRGVL